MDTTSLESLLRDSTRVLCVEDGLRLVAEPNWVLAGEARLSYTTLVRLVECCREHHWQQDIRWGLSGNSIDTTCKSMGGQFFRPVKVGDNVDIVYRVVEVRNRSYRVRFSVLSADRLQKYAEIELVMVFYDSSCGKSVVPPVKVTNHLMNLVTDASSEYTGDDDE